MLEFVKVDGNLIFIAIDSIESIEEYQDEDGETITVILTKTGTPHYTDESAVSLHNDLKTIREAINAEKPTFQLS